jgi:hypothetical protein
VIVRGCSGQNGPMRRTPLFSPSSLTRIPPADWHAGETRVSADLAQVPVRLFGTLLPELFTHRPRAELLSVFNVARWIGSQPKELDVCLLSGSGELLERLAAPPDADALRTLAGRIDEAYREPVCAVIESMTGARLVHDTLEQEGWDVESPTRRR